MRVFDHLVYLAQLHGLGRRAATRAAEDLLEALALSERAADRVESLSLGNQQRVQLAAALAHDPTVLVLDEPFSGLDPMGIDAMAAVLRTRVDNGAAVVFSSHQLDLVERLCDAVGIIQAGRMVADGPVDVLRGGGARRFRLQVDAGPEWPKALAERIPGLTLLDTTDSTALVELPSDTDDQRLLDLARELGPTRQFTPVRPSLTELFREAVTDSSESSATGKGTTRYADQRKPRDRDARPRGRGTQPPGDDRVLRLHRPVRAAHGLLDVGRDGCGRGEVEPGRRGDARGHPGPRCWWARSSVSGCSAPSSSSWWPPWASASRQ